MKPYRYRKKLVKQTGSRYVLLPANWVNNNFSDDEQEVIVEVWPKEIRIYPYKD